MSVDRGDAIRIGQGSARHLDVLVALIGRRLDDDVEPRVRSPEILGEPAGADPRKADAVIYHARGFDDAGAGCPPRVREVRSPDKIETKVDRSQSRRL